MMIFRFRPIYRIPVFILFLFFPTLLSAQEKRLDGNSFDVFVKNIFTQDTVLSGFKNVEARDTAIRDMPDIYKKIKASSKSNIGKSIYNALIREPSQPDIPVEKQDYKPYEGKIIEAIEIIVLNPFGTDVDNPLVGPVKGVQKNANDLHIRTKKNVIRNNLQFKEGDPVNSVIISETETYLRNLGYINDARIKIQEIALIDRVIIQVVVRDVWSLGVDISELSGSALDISVFDKNIFGYGNRTEVNFIYDKNYSRRTGYGAGYLHKNLMHTFIDLEGFYLDDIKSRKLSLSAERPLQTTLKNFGQISFFTQNGRPGIIGWDSISPDRIKNFSVSFGRAVTLPAKDVVKRLVFAGRYLEKSPEYIDVTLPENFLLPYDHVKKRSFLFQASLYQQAYYKEHLIHGFGVTEDIAHGYNLSAQIGYTRFPQYKSGVYASFSASGGKNMKIGNFYAAAAVSSYFNNGDPFEGVLKFDLHYFSPLQRSGRYRFRHFLNIDYSRLLNPVGSFDHSIYFSQLTNLYTWNSRYDAAGNERLAFNLESDMFTPFNVAGFRFLLYSFIDIAWIGKNKLFSNNNLYGGIGLGIRIRNDLLVFKTIELKVGYYPRFDQSGFNDFFDIDTSYPKVSPNFVPGYPDEIPLN